MSSSEELFYFLPAEQELGDKNYLWETSSYVTSVKLAHELRNEQKKSTGKLKLREEEVPTVQGF